MIECFSVGVHCFNTIEKVRGLKFSVSRPSSRSERSAHAVRHFCFQSSCLPVCYKKIQETFLEILESFKGKKRQKN